MTNYKDIINFTLIRKLKGILHDSCIIFNNLVKEKNIKNRESEFYEVYTEQYKEDIANVQNLRDKAQKIADICNSILLNMNTYHIKQYYLDKNELSEYEDFEEYKQQEFEENTNIPVEQTSKNSDDEEDIW